MGVGLVRSGICGLGRRARLGLGNMIREIGFRGVFGCVLGVWVWFGVVGWSCWRSLSVSGFSVRLFMILGCLVIGLIGWHEGLMAAD